MHRKWAGALVLLGLTWALSTQVSLSQTPQTATLTLHGYQTSATDSVPGVDLAASTGIVAIKVWADQDSCVFSLPSTMPTTWQIDQQYESGGYTFCYATTYNPGDAVSSGHVLNVAYTGTDSVQLVDTATFPAKAQYWYGQYRTDIDATVTGSASHSETATVTYSIHSGPTHGSAGLDITSDRPIRTFWVAVNKEMGTFRVSLADTLPSTWVYVTSTNGAASTIVGAQTTDDDSTITGGHVLDFRFAGPDSLEADKTAIKADDGLSYNRVSYAAGTGTWATAWPTWLDSVAAPNIDTYVSQANHPGVMGGFDKGHSGIFPAVFPDTIIWQWSKPGVPEGAPVFHIGNYVISAEGHYSGTTLWDSVYVSCRVDTSGALVWKTTVQDSMYYLTAPTWPVGAWMGADSLVYVSRLTDIGDQIGRVTALNMEDGSVKWIAAHDSLVAGSADKQPGVLVMDDGDIVCLDFTPGEWGVTRFDAADGSIVWSHAHIANWWPTSQQCRSLMAYTWDSTEYILTSETNGDLVFLRASDGLVIKRQALMHPRSGIIPPNMVSVSAMTDSVTPKMTLMYYADPGAPDLQTFLTGMMNGTYFEQLSWSTSQTLPAYPQTHPCWLVPSATDSVHIGPLAILPVSSGGKKVASVSVPGTGSSQGWTYNKSLWNMGDAAYFAPIAFSDTSRSVIVLNQGNYGEIRMYKNVVTQAPVAPPNATTATLMWSMPFSGSLTCSQIAAYGNRIWMNWGGTLVCYKDRVAETPEPPSRPPRSDTLEP